MLMRINRNIVECKERSRSRTGTRMHVLIETLWNVKYHRCDECLRYRSVLIETLWNVKQRSGLRSFRADYGINRNIVECKVRGSLFVATMYTPVLIETLWNVKSEAHCSL